MNNPKLLHEKREMDSLFTQVAGFSGDPYIQSLLTYYLCVRVSGFVENCLRIILTDYSDPRAQDQVHNFVMGKLKRFPNPTFDQICRIIGEFDDQWNRRFKAGVSSPIRQSLESININRNAIAHGGTSTITVKQLQGYYRDAVILIEMLERVCT